MMTMRTMRWQAFTEGRVFRTAVATASANDMSRAVRCFFARYKGLVALRLRWSRPRWRSHPTDAAATTPEVLREPLERHRVQDAIGRYTALAGHLDAAVHVV